MSGILLAGALVGVLYGLFGVGSSFATPALSFLGIPPLAAVVSPLPAFLPSSMAGLTPARARLEDGMLVVELQETK